MRGSSLFWAVVCLIYVTPSAGAGLEPTDCDALQTVEARNRCYAEACFYLHIAVEMEMAGLNHDIERWKREVASYAMFCNKVPDEVTARTKNWNWCVWFATYNKKRGIDTGLTCDRAGQK
jgi:hypothetical protein